MTARLFCVLIAALALGVPAVHAGRYWVAWEGDDYPESQGWERGTGGGGCIRTLEDGLLGLDGSASNQIWDSYKQSRPGEFHVDPGEQFVVEWRLKVVSAARPDPGITFFTDNAHLMIADFSYDYVEVGDTTNIPIVPGVFHDYRLITSDMFHFQFFIDGEYIATKTPYQAISASFLVWGDQAIGGGTGAASVWDYVRFGVIPEPSAMDALLVSCVAFRPRWTARMVHKSERTHR